MSKAGSCGRSDPTTCACGLEAGMFAGHDLNSDALENGCLGIVMSEVDFSQDSRFRPDRNLQCILSGAVDCKGQLPGLSRISQKSDLIEALEIPRILKYSPGLLPKFHNCLHSRTSCTRYWKTYYSPRNQGTSPYRYYCMTYQLHPGSIHLN